MRLRRIEIKSFKKLAGPVVLDELGDGLILVSGANEEGKSTVLAALKAAFFEHHNVTGAVRDAMAPHGGGTPEVGVTFECGGRPYRLTKAFRRGGIRLECNEARWSDDAAERQLQEMLRFERRQGRTPKPENAGLQALFWVDQATTFQGFETVAGGRDRLTAAISGEVGAIANGERARRLLTLAKERAGALLTANRQQETGALKAAAERLQRLETERTQLAAKRREHEARVDRLARLREERRRFIAQDELGRARTRLAELERRLAEVEGLARTADLAAEGVKASAAERSRHAAAWKSRLDLLGEAERQQGAEAALVRRLQEAEQELAVLREVEQETGKAAKAAAQAVLAAEQDCAARRERLTASVLQDELERLRASLAHAEASRTAAAQAKAIVQQQGVTPTALAKLRELVARRDEAVGRLEAAATRIELHPERTAGATLAGSPLDTGQPLHLVERTEIVLEGWGRLVILPGGTELAQRQRALELAETALAQAMRELGVASIAEAETAVDRQRQAAADLARHEREFTDTLKACGARTLDELRERVLAQASEFERLSARTNAEPEALGGPELAATLREAEVVLAAAVEAQQRTRREAETAATRVAQAQARKAGLEGESRALAREAEAVRQRLALLREQQPDEELRAAVRRSEEAWRQAEERYEAVERQLRAADPEGLRERHAIALRELDALEAERQRLERDVRDLEVALKESGIDEWGERLAELEGEIAAASDHYRRLRREALAWRLLQERLQAADQAARDALVAPVVARLMPDLQRLFPGAEPVLDAERLSLSYIKRNGIAEAYESLSVGAREQVAVLVRLAFARLLQEHEDEPACLILDDALVYADEARFEIMKAILQRAAKDLQILILTCRPRDYFGLDARHVRLEECSRG